MKHVVGFALPVLVALALADPTLVGAVTCPTLCRKPIKACHKAVPANTTCPPGKTHAACIKSLKHQRALCKPTLLAQCKQNPHPTTCGVSPTVCDFTQHPCMGTLTGGVNASFGCANSFANSLRQPGQTSFMLSVVTPPSGVSNLGFVLDFVGSPAVKEYDFPATPPNGEFLATSYVALNVPSTSPFGTTYKAGAGGFLGGDGPMKMTLASADPRTPPQTPGDWCLHGSVDATMTITGAGGNSVTLHADF